MTHGASCASLASPDWTCGMLEEVADNVHPLENEAGRATGSLSLFGNNFRDKAVLHALWLLLQSVLTSKAGLNVATQFVLQFEPPCVQHPQA